MKHYILICGIATLIVSAVAYLAYRIFVSCSESPETRDTGWTGLALFSTICWGGFAVFLVILFTQLAIL